VSTQQFSESASRDDSLAPRLAWLKQRAAGLLAHPTTFDGEFGIGTFGPSTDAFLEFVSATGFTYWQVCPLGPTGYGDSPYQCFSSFAGSPYLINLAPLVGCGLLAEADLNPLRNLPRDRVDFGGLYRAKLPLLFSAHQAWRRAGGQAVFSVSFDEFRRRHAAWLPSYAFFSALKDHHAGRPWWEWPTAQRSFELAASSPLRTEIAGRTEAYEFIQYLFFGQWSAIRAHAARRGISIIGDTPIFTALDSADVWTHPRLFQINRRTHRPTAVAGVPPDYFSADGQLWGNPLYDWPVHAADGYAWWLSRLRASLEFYDVVRLDHFRGFESYWAIPAGAPNARAGRWVKGPGLDLFRAIAAGLPGLRLIAEDLGLLTPEVLALREATGLPGMAVLQFAFGGGADNLYLPHNLRSNCVVYPGTHDNDTTRGWYATADERARDHVRRYLRVHGEDIAWDFVRAAFSSVANLAVIPLPDLLNLGSEGRFNTPGQAQGNWTWRCRADRLRRLADESGAYLRELAVLSGRDTSLRREAGNRG